MGSRRVILAGPALAAVLGTTMFAFDDARGSVLSISHGARATQLTLPFSGSVSSSSIAFHVIQTGSGPSGRFAINSSTNSNFALEGVTAGSGHALLAWNYGLGRGAVIIASNSSNTLSALDVGASGIGRAGLGVAADIRANNRDSTAPAAHIRNYGNGAVLMLDHRGAGGDLATFDAAGAHRARLTRSGRGVFADGIRTAPHGITEALAADGAVSNYARGDVLVISSSGDSHVAKSSSAYSRRVVGVVAGSQGVVLTGASIDSGLDSTLSVGILGVFPVRVSAGNGAIARGDLLVTSPNAGAAMRATNFPAGAILGKSMGSFSGSGTGTIPAVLSLQ
jgi:hypothetical protein